MCIEIMPRDLRHVIDVVAPHGLRGCVKSTPLDSAVLASSPAWIGPRLKYIAHDYESKWSYKNRGSFLGNKLDYFPEHSRLILEKKNCTVYSTSRLRHEFRRLCKTFPFLPNPVSSMFLPKTPIKIEVSNCTVCFYLFQSKLNIGLRVK